MFLAKRTELYLAFMQPRTSRKRRSSTSSANEDGSLDVPGSASGSPSAHSPDVPRSGNGSPLARSVDVAGFANGSPSTEEEAAAAEDLLGMSQNGPAKKRRGWTPPQWTELDMQTAVFAVEFEGISEREAARRYNVGRSSLHNWLNGLVTTHKKGPDTHLGMPIEKMLKQWVLGRVESGFPVSKLSLRVKVGEIASELGRPFPGGLPGTGWFKRFKARHPDLALRSPSSLSRARARCFNKVAVSSFFTNYKYTINNGAYPVTNIWNADETGVTIGRDNGMHVLAKGGMKEVSQIVPDSKEWVTIMCAVSAAGTKIPCLYIFKGTRYIIDWVANCEPGAAFATGKKAWMSNETFVGWLVHFRRHVPGGVSTTNRHLLICDGHGSHLTEKAVIAARDMGISQYFRHTVHTTCSLWMSVASHHSKRTSNVRGPSG